jgi:lysophospholipase L1-like esterase
VKEYDRRMERIPARRAGLALLVATCALALLSAPATAHPAIGPRTPFTPGSTYLALGDSVTFGYLEPTVVPAPNYHHAASFMGYPEHLAAELHTPVVNAACPGETSASLINANAPSNGCENTGKLKVGYRTLYPLHVAYKGSQLAFSVRYLRTHPRVRLVSLMIGFNDFFLCEKTTPDACLAPSELKPLLAKITRNVRTIIAAIRHRAHYRGQLIIVHYYSLDYANRVINHVVQAVNAAQDAGARSFHVKHADGYGLFAAQARFYHGDACAAALVTRLSTGTCGVHPTFAGQALLAEAVLRALRL